MPGDVEYVSPHLGDVHQVRNAYSDRVSISIHAYGGNIGKIKRRVFAADTGSVKDFISGYATPTN
jgi:predicted metal-dependent enzyme (double-stranded beta helix superfamily)